MNHASREILGRIYISDDAKFPCQILASVISLNLQSEFFIFTFVSTRLDFTMVFRYFIDDAHCRTSVVHEYRADTFLRILRKSDGTVSFPAIISYGASRFFPRSLLLHRPCHIINFALSLRLFCWLPRTKYLFPNSSCNILISETSEYQQASSTSLTTARRLHLRSLKELQSSKK